MNDFVFQKSNNSNVIKSIRFPEAMDAKINSIVKEANKGKSKKNIVLMDSWLVPANMHLII